MNELGLSLSHPIGVALQPYADWLDNKQRLFLETISDIQDGVYSSGQYVAIGKYAILADNLHSILKSSAVQSVDFDVSLMDTNVGVRNLITNSNTTVYIDDVLNEIKTTSQSTQVVSAYVNALKGSIDDASVKLSVFNNSITELAAVATEQTKSVISYANNLMLDVNTTGLDKVKQMISFITPRNLSSTSTIASDASEYTGAAPCVCFGTILFNTISQIVPAIVTAAATVVGGVFGTLFTTLYTAGNYVYNTIATGGTSLSVIKKVRRYSDYGIGNDVCWYRVVSGPAAWSYVKNALSNLTGYSGDNSILSIPLFGSSVYLKTNGSYLLIGFRYSLTNNVNFAQLTTLISDWLVARNASNDPESIDATYSTQFKSMTWVDSDVEAGPLDDVSNTGGQTICRQVLRLIAIHLSWYVEVYEEDYNSNSHPLLYWYKSMFNPVIIDASNNVRDDLYYGVKGIHNSQSSYDVDQKTNKALYLLTTSRYAANGYVDVYSNVQGFDAVGRCLQLFFENLSLSQDVYFIPHNWLESMPGGVYQIKTDSSLSTEYGLIVTAASVVAATSLITIGLSVVKARLKKAAFNARRRADNIAFDANASNKQAWKANKKANFLEGLVGSADTISGTVAISDASIDLVKDLKGYTSGTLYNEVGAVKEDVESSSQGIGAIQEKIGDAESLNSIINYLSRLANKLPA